MVQFLQEFGLQGLVPNTPYALPPFPCRLITSVSNFSFSATVDGVYTALTTPQTEPGALLDGGFIKNTAAGPRFAQVKRISRLETYPAVVSRSNPIALWRLNEAVGPTAFSSFGLYPLTYGSGVTLGQTTRGGDGATSALFDGTANGDAVSAAVNPWANGTALSFEAWVFNPSWGASHEIVINLANVGLYLSVNNKQPFMSIQLGAVQFTNNLVQNLPTNEWVHLVGTWATGEQIRLYVNGVEGLVYNNTTARSGAMNTSSGIYVGALGGSALPWSGRLADVALYLTRLTAAEVISHYAARNNKV